MRDRKGDIRRARKSTPGRSGRAELKHLAGLTDNGEISEALARGVRGPLNVLMGSAAFLRRKYADDRTLIEFTNIMEKEVLCLDRFVAKLMSTGIFDRETQDTDLQPFLKQMETAISLQAESCNIEVSFECDCDCHVTINSSCLEHALLDIISNVSEAMPSGGTLSVRTQALTAYGREFALIEISGTGLGPRETKNCEEVPSSVSPKKEGGKGLFVAREVLRACGGHLEIAGRKKRETAVKLYIPAKK
jgi:two-component system sensor histidine kinase HydH